MLRGARGRRPGGAPRSMLPGHMSSGTASLAVTSGSRAARRSRRAAALTLTLTERRWCGGQRAALPAAPAILSQRGASNDDL